MKEIFEDKLKRLNEDESMILAIEALFTEETDNSRPDADGDDAKVGQDYKAYLEAQEIIKRSFIKLRQFTYSTKSKAPKNRAV